LFNLFKKSGKTDAPAAEAPDVAQPAVAEEPVSTAIATEKAGFFARIKQGLSRTSNNFADGLGNLFLGRKTIDDDLLEDIETQLLVADVGITATTEIIDNL